jgi:hypothetical protein
MYVETDFLLALVKPDDWLGDRAETLYREHQDELWTSEFTLIELMLVAYREGRNVERTVAEAKQLVDVDGDAEGVLAAASHVEESGFTPFDALHLVRSEADPVVTSEQDYETFSDRIPLEADE